VGGRARTARRLRDWASVAGRRPYAEGDHSVAEELDELYDADRTPKASRIWNVLAGQAKAQR